MFSPCNYEVKRFYEKVSAISYSNTVGFRGGYDREDIFELTDPAAVYEFDYTLGFSLKDGYKKDNEEAVANLVKPDTAAG